MGFYIFYTDFEHPFGPDDIDDSSDGFIDTGDGD